MMNLTRGESFTIEVFFDLDMDALESFEVLVMQNGKTVMRKGMEEAVIDRDEKRAWMTLSGEETARLSSGGPAWAQTRGILTDGETLHSEVEEINAVDTLRERGDRPWC